MSFAERANAIGCGPDHGWPHEGIELKDDLVAWAEPLRLRWNPTAGSCVHWLTEGVDHGSCTARLSYPGWTDHMSAWTRHGVPAVIVAQPYHLDTDERVELLQLQRRYDIEVVIKNRGWYGGSYQIELWRGGRWH